MKKHCLFVSRPARARGLKLNIVGGKHNYIVVAPRAGAWIETISVPTISRKNNVAPRAGAWIETTVNAGASLVLQVAPRAGAWIETWSALICLAMTLSRPARARGLKHPSPCHVANAGDVAPRAGAWIETRYGSPDELGTSSRPARARGLKRALEVTYNEDADVAPRVGAWIEMFTCSTKQQEIGSRLIQGATSPLCREVCLQRIKAALNARHTLRRPPQTKPCKLSCRKLRLYYHKRNSRA